MTPTSHIVKITAKATLNGKWVKGIIAAAILLFTFFISYNIASVLSLVAGDITANVLLIILAVFMCCPIALGLFRYYWRFLFEADDNPIAVFYYFSDFSLYKRALSFIFAFAFKIIFWSILLNLPRFIVEAMSHSFIYELVGLAIPVWTANLTNITVFLEIIAIVVLFFIMVKFYIAPVLFVADDNIDSAEAMHMSSIISKKTSVDFFYLVLSFIGWILLSFTVVPLIFTLPYILIAYLIHVRFAVAEYNRHIEAMSKIKFPSFTVYVTEKY